jgi:hypothetical protein
MHPSRNAGRGHVRALHNPKSETRACRVRLKAFYAAKSAPPASMPRGRVVQLYAALRGPPATPKFKTTN